MESFWPQSWIVFLLAFYPANLCAVLLHELGHVLAAQLVGRRVFAWGIGASRVFFRMPLGKQRFYLGLPLNMGFTIACPNALGCQPISEFLFILGGPLITVVGLVAGLALWEWGINSDLLLAWIAVSAILAVTSIIPFPLTIGRIHCDNDAKLLGKLLIRGRQVSIGSVGAALQTMNGFADLLEQAGCRPGANLFQVYACMLETSLGNSEATRARLSQIDVDSLARLPTGKATYALAWSALSVDSNSDDAENRLATARELFGNDVDALFHIDCLHLEWKLVQGHDILAALDQLTGHAEDAARRDWLCALDVLRFNADDTSDPEERCLRLLSAYETFISDVTTAELLAATTERLVLRGAIDRARTFFQRAQLAIAESAEAISDTATREAFIRWTAAPLQRAVIGTQNDLPLFIPDTGTLEPKRTKSLRRLFAYATVVLGCASLGTAFLALNMPPGQSTSQAAGFVLLVFCFFVLALISTLISILRREQHYVHVSAGLVLAILGMLLAVLSDVNRREVKPPHFRGSHYRGQQIEIETLCTIHPTLGGNLLGSTQV